jgi:hypothetical protein
MPSSKWCAGIGSLIGSLIGTVVAALRALDTTRFSHLVPTSLRRVRMLHHHVGHHATVSAAVDRERRARRVRPTNRPEEDAREDQRGKEAADGNDHAKSVGASRESVKVLAMSRAEKISAVGSFMSGKP